MIFSCFGDSLTAGWPGYYPASDGTSLGNGNIQSQYEYWLKKKCLEYINENAKELYEKFTKELVFVNKGIPGDTSTGLLHRISEDILSYKPKPNYCIIIIGTNDLGWSSSTDKILNNIQELHKITRDFGIISIGGLIPPITKRSSSPKWDIIRSDFNEELKQYFIEKDIAFTDYGYMIDEEDYLRPENTSGDGVHFSVLGYKMMGYSLFDNVIKSILEVEIKKKEKNNKI